MRRNPPDSPLSMPEVAGVVAVGFGLAWLVSRAYAQESDMRAPVALAGGAALYTLGVYVGNTRPEQGWLGLEAK